MPRPNRAATAPASGQSREQQTEPRRLTRQAQRAAGSKRTEPPEAGQGPSRAKRLRRDTGSGGRAQHEADDENAEPLGLDFDKINEAIQPQREKSRTPRLRMRTAKSSNPRATGAHAALGMNPYDVPDGESEDRQDENDPSRQLQNEANQQLLFESAETVLLPTQRAASEELGSMAVGGTGRSQLRTATGHPTTAVQSTSTSVEDNGLAAPNEDDIPITQEESDDGINADLPSGTNNEPAWEQSITQVDPDRSRPDESIMMGDDSILFDASQDADQIRVTLSSKSLKDLVDKLGTSAWACGGRTWDENFLAMDNGQNPRSAWLQNHTVGTKATMCRKLLQYLHRFWECVREIPKAPHFPEQRTFMRENEETIRKFLRIIDSGIQSIRGRQSSSWDLPPGNDGNETWRPDWATETVKWLRQQLVPMTALLLREVFLLGGQGEADDKPELLNKGEFTYSSLDLLFRVKGWTHKLNDVLQKDLQYYPPKPVTDTIAEGKKLRTESKHRYNFKKHLYAFTTELDRGLREREELIEAPKRRQEAIERDRIVKEERERKRRELEEEESLQLQRFYASTQKVGMSMKSSQSSDRVAAFASTQRTRTSIRSSQSDNRNITLASTQRTSASVRSPEEEAREHYRKHGFHFWEDEVLLKRIRVDPQPNYRELQESFVDRSPEELERRAEEIRAFSRAKYKAWGLVPPTWCYSPIDT